MLGEPFRPGDAESGSKAGLRQLVTLESDIQRVLGWSVPPR